MDNALIKPVTDFIAANWPLTVRHNPQDEGELIGLPYPYTVPCVEGDFQEMFYWDTFFTTVGLKAAGYHDLVKSNTDNLLWLVDKYGFVPNGNRTFYLNRSQPPFLSSLVRDVYELTGDKVWLAAAYQTLVREYKFWQERRNTPSGLNRYWQEAKHQDLVGIYHGVLRRVKIPEAEPPLPEEEMAEQGAHFMAECESGHDFTPRFKMRCGDYAPVDLNCNLYVYEQNLAYFSSALDNGAASGWQARARLRQDRLNECCWQPQKGLYSDYNWRTARPSPVVTAAGLYPLWAGAASPEQAARVVDNLLPQLEYAFGIAACSPTEQALVYQWDYPNGWPPLQYITIAGLSRYGYQTEARRVATKYVATVINCFAATGHLWEKYNVVDGSTNTADEYAMPTMLGWTAGVFRYALQQL